MSKQHAESINLHQVLCPSDIAAWRMKLAKAGVDSMFGRKAYDRIDKEDRINIGLCDVKWGA